MKIYKFILLWISILSCILFIAGGCEFFVKMDNRSLALVWALVNGIFVLLCRYTLTIKDVITLSGAKWLNHKLS